jgi:hypothetical protein
VTGVLTVIGGWFLTALVAFSVSLLFAFAIYYFKLAAILGLLVLLIALVWHTYRLHFKRAKEKRAVEVLALEKTDDAETAVHASFEQTGHFLKEVSDSLALCFEAAFSEDRQRLREATVWTSKIQKWANIIISNTFETLFLLRSDSVDDTQQQYAKTMRFMQGIAESHRDMIKRSYVHFENCHDGFSEDQKEELRRIKAYLTRLLWNTSIMLTKRKKVDHDYIHNQRRRLENLVNEFDKNQIKRIQDAESKTRVSILFYGLLENSVKIAEQTEDLLVIFRESFTVK